MRWNWNDTERVVQRVVIPVCGVIGAMVDGLTDSADPATAVLWVAMMGLGVPAVAERLRKRKEDR